MKPIDIISKAIEDNRKLLRTIKQLDVNAPLAIDVISNRIKSLEKKAEKTKKEKL